MGHLPRQSVREEEGTSMGTAILFSTEWESNILTGTAGGKPKTLCKQYKDEKGY